MQAAAQAAAQREAALLRRAIANQNLLRHAQEAEKEGDLRLASRLYQRVALRRPRTAANVTAQQRLAKFQDEAQAKLESLESRLTALGGQGSSSGDAPAKGLRRVQSAELDPAEVTKVFEELEQLVLEYAGIATVEDRLQKRLEQLSGRPQYAAILQEPAAAELWTLGQQYEAEQKICCAAITYEEAAKLSHAPSARQARMRLAELEKDQEIVAATRRCRVLQTCHDHYDMAQQLKESLPARAREYLAKVVELAPRDTSVYQAAREQLAMLQ